jgi:hypothetical protein
MRRLRATRWPKQLVFWTITTDPGILSPEEALQTMARRWHLVCRNLLRHYPHLRFFKVLEFTQSGLPHFHVIFDRWVSWHVLHDCLTHEKFGRVLHFKTMPRDAALSYLTKYITKALGSFQLAHDLHIRFWSASVRFLPLVTWFQHGTEFQIVWEDHLGFRLEDTLKYYQDFALGERL